MIKICKEKIHHIPCLFVTLESKKDQALPTVVYYHGFNGEKEANLTIAYKLAEKGFRVVLPDSLYHGERKVEMSQTAKDMEIWNIVLTNLNDLQMIKHHLDAKNLLLNERFGLAGTSMGGITTSAALVKYDWIKVASVVMGTPKMVDYAEMLIDVVNEKHPDAVSDAERVEVIQQLVSYDLSKHPEKASQRPILFWHGEKDNVVPASHVIEFVNEMKADNIRFVKEPGRMHHVSRLAMKETVNWFADNL